MLVLSVQKSRVLKLKMNCGQMSYRDIVALGTSEILPRQAMTFGLRYAITRLRLSFKSLIKSEMEDAQRYIQAVYEDLSLLNEHHSSPVGKANLVILRYLSEELRVGKLSSSARVKAALKVKEVLRELSARAELGNGV